MAKTITNISVFVAIEPYTMHTNTFTCLRLDVSYRKGKGFYVDYHAGWGNETCWGCELNFSNEQPLTDNISLLVLPANKNNSKTLQKIADNFSTGVAKKIVAFLFNERNFFMLNECIKDIALHGGHANVAQLDKLMAAAHKNESNDSNNNNNSTIKNSTTMGKNVANDLIGRVLIVANGKGKYTITSVNGESVTTHFEIEGGPSYDVPLTITGIKDMIANNQGHWEGEEPTAKPTEDETDAEEITSEDVEKMASEPVEQVEPIAEQPKAEPKTEQPIREHKLYATRITEPKTEQPKKKSAPKGTYKFETYKTKRTGKEGGKIFGFTEDSPIYQASQELHGAKTWVYKNGNRIYGLMFGPRYKDAAEEMCKALNNGADLEECATIIEGNTEALKQQHEEKRAEYAKRRAEREAAKAEKATATNAKAAATNATAERMYTESEVKTRLYNMCVRIAKDTGSDIKDFEPYIQAA